MIAQTVDAANRRTAEVGAPGAGQRRDDPVLNYRVDVLASDTADLLRSIGGWLYDLTAAGWDVNVLSPRHSDTRALQILGLRAAELEPLLVQPDSLPAKHGLVVSPDIFASDARVREVVLATLDCRITALTLIGDDWPPAVGHRTVEVRHVLSAAARAFKSHALAAAGISSTLEPIETLRTDRTNVTLASLWLPSVAPA